MPVQTQLQMRRDTAANWTSTNPTLASGEWGLETDTRLMKIGDGATAWNSLGYQLNSLLDEDLATSPTGAYFDGSGLNLYAVDSNFAQAPDSAALDITGDIDIRAKIAMTDWTPASNIGILAKNATGTTQISYTFQVAIGGALLLQWTTNGTTNITKTSTANPTVSDGGTLWVRATLDVDNGAAGNDVTFYTSADGSTWTQLGNVVTTAGTTSVYSGTGTLQIGANSTTVSRFTGTIYRVQVLNGIGGTTAFDANFETVPADSFAFTESSANAATVTLTTTRYSFGVPGAVLTGTGTNTTGVNGTTYIPFRVVNKPITLKHLAFEVTAIPAGTSTVKLAIYKADSQMQPTGAPVLNGIDVSTAAATAIYRVRLTPFVLNPGNYLVACNSTTRDLTLRTFLGFVNFATNTLGANLTINYQVIQTLSGNYPDTPVKWNVRNNANGPGRNMILLGWS